MFTTQFQPVISPMTVEAIQSLDLTMLKRKLMDSEEGEGWTEAQCVFATQEYKRFLQIVLEFGNAVPNRIMDTVWHYHILDTKAYYKDCMAVFGEFIHHYPYFGMNGEDDKKNLLNSFEETKSQYLSLFGEPIDRLNGVFDLTEAGHCHVCKCVCSRCNRS